MHEVYSHSLGWSWPSWRQQQPQDYYREDQLQELLKKQVHHIQRDFDILRNHSFWNVIDGGISVGGLFSFWVWYIVNVYVYFFIIITIIVLFKFSLIIENFFKKNIDLIDFTLSVLLINK